MEALATLIRRGVDTPAMLVNIPRITDDAE